MRIVGTWSVQSRQRRLGLTGVRGLRAAEQPTRETQHPDLFYEAANSEFRIERRDAVMSRVHESKCVCRSSRRG
jgi:hypothetical protein